MSTKEAYIKAKAWFLHQAIGETARGKLTDMSNHVASLESHLAAKDAEIAELRAKYELQLDAWKRDGAKIAELSTAYISLYARIEAAPKVWILRKPRLGGDFEPRMERPPPYSNVESLRNQEYIEVYCVPVEEEKEG